ncbi:Uncharacterised protein [Mycobacteroides abscessus subsp. abscessus]|nr:Uncharacterised protein [Mycobacteroides abscessus subsp. abscessus]SKV50298.1 Uncharacterised protein [Mycobacteroides abscessus subsp. abscessus]
MRDDVLGENEYDCWTANSSPATEEKVLRRQ